MRTYMTVGVVLVAMLAAGCGSSDEPKKKEQVMKVEDTAFGPLVGTPKKVQDKTDAAAEQYRETLNERLEEDEGGSPKRDEPPAD